MKFSLFSLLSGLVAFASASPIVKYVSEEDGLDISPRDVSAQTCKKVQLVVSILKLNKATPFCSSFLHIPTQTVEVTEVIPRTITQTESTVVYTTVTVVAQTNTATVPETQTIATLPTIVATSIIPSVSVFVSTVTPPPAAPVTTTIYTTPAAKRQVEEREVGERAIKLPQYIAAFASSAISQACSCLSIGAPVTTKTVTQYATNTVLTTATAISTNTALSTAETTVTNTVYTTLYVPTTTVTTSVTVSTSVTTLAPVTSTVTVNRPLPTNCRDILSGQKLYSSASTARNLGPDSSVPDRFFATRDEFTWSQCCGYGYSIPNSGVIFFSDRGAAAGASRYACRVWTNSDSVNTAVSPSCPLGVLPSGVTGVGGQGASGFMLGPCFGSNPRPL
ncbi:hypothetical protein ABW20_dc0109705 [Dactylellina cionopaga]|nr:hypothetical protein ABW20_dc0109705 [Dactylellina cionopaga]